MRILPDVIVSLLCGVGSYFATDKDLFGLIGHFGIPSTLAFLVYFSIELLVLLLGVFFYYIIRSFFVKANISLNAMPRNDEKYLSIQIKNNSKSEEVVCYGILKQLVWFYNPTTAIIRTRTINPSNSKLSWSKGSINEYKPIMPLDHGVMNIAKLFGNMLVFTFHGEEKQHPISGEFLIWVEVGCKITNEYVGSEFFKGRFRIVYDRFSDLSFEFDKFDYDTDQYKQSENRGQ